MAKAMTKTYNPTKDMISIMLPRATGNEDNFVLVGLNGKLWKIKRGQTVRVPRPIYDILCESERMEDRLVAFNEAAAAKSVPG